MMAKSQCLCFWIYLQHLTLMTMKFYYIVFIMCLDLATLCSWFQSYLENRTQTIVVHGKHSTPASFRYGVPQGSLLGPILFILYTQPLLNVIQYYPVFHQIYADDTQIYKSCRPSEIVDTINSIEQCISNVKTWMFHNKLQMNDDKTKAILFA